MRCRTPPRDTQFTQSVTAVPVVTHCFAVLVGGLEVLGQPGQLCAGRRLGGEGGDVYHADVNAEVSGSAGRSRACVGSEQHFRREQPEPTG